MANFTTSADLLREKLSKLVPHEREKFLRLVGVESEPLPDGFHCTPSGAIRKQTSSSNHEYTWGVCEFCKRRFLGLKQQRKWKARFCSRECKGHSLRKDHITPTGYRVIGARKEHLTVAERALGRSLRKGEVVHHVNMDKLDNRPCNLMICTKKYHNWLHVEYAKAFARELNLG